MENYEEKFTALIKLCEQLKPGDEVRIAFPQALGDTYEELIESLNRIADAEGRLIIVPRSERNLTALPYKSN